MKRFLVAFLLPVFLFTSLAVAPMTLTSCESPRPAVVEVGQDPVVVHAEQAYAEAHDTLDAIYNSDRDNRTLILKYAPEVHRQINALKPRAKLALDNVKHVIAAYKGSRTADNKATLTTYLTTLAAILKEAQQYQQSLASVPLH